MSPSSGKGLHEVELPSFDVAEIDVEDLGPLAEPADHREDLAGRLFKLGWRRRR
jgi:hypothetical protein